MKQMFLSAAAVFLIMQPAQDVGASEPAVPAGVSFQPPLNAQPALPPRLRNVQLSPDHRLTMQVVNSAGEPLPGAAVTVAPPGKQQQPQQMVSDANGEVHASIPFGGTVVIQIGQDLFACRAWSPGTAPPGSVKRVALVDQQDSVVRANRQKNNCCEPERTAQRLDRGYGLAVLALGSTAAYFALSRDNASD